MSSANSLNIYSSIDRHSHVEGDDRHAMISALLDELLRRLTNLSRHLQAGNTAADGRNDDYAKALAILHTLQTALDFDRGGDIAPNLFRIYEFVRQELLLCLRTGEREDIDAAISCLMDIRDGWRGMDLSKVN